MGIVARCTSENLLDDGTALDTGIVGNGLAWDANGAADNVNANLLVLVGTCHIQQVGDATQQGDTATGDDAFFNGGASGAQGILS